MSFFQIFHEKPHAGMPIFGQKNVNFVKTTINYGPKKSKGCPFESHFSRKNINSHAHILSKKRPFQKNHASLMPIFCQKNVHYLKNTMLSCHLFQFFHEKPLLSYPYLVKKTSILSKLHYIMGQKSQ